VLPSCATSRGRSPIRHLGTRVAAVVPRQVSLSLTRADNHMLKTWHNKIGYGRGHHICLYSTLSDWQ